MTHTAKCRLLVNGQDCPELLSPTGLAEALPRPLLSAELKPALTRCSQKQQWGPSLLCWPLTGPTCFYVFLGPNSLSLPAPYLLVLQAGTTKMVRALLLSSPILTSQGGGN